MEVIFLGTSAGLPTLKRNSAATAIVREGEIFLFDCGEGTQVQLQKAKLRPGKLCRIFISHFHGDHFYGLIGLLTSLQLGGRTTPVYLYSPEGLQDYMAFMQKMSHFAFNYDIEYHEVSPETPEAGWDFRDYRITARFLEHRLPTLGFRFAEFPRPGKFDTKKAARLGIPDGPVRGRLQRGQTVELSNGQTVVPEQVIGPQQPGKTVSICSDCRPCNNTMILAKNADLLIHEATFDASRQELALISGHSTAAEAAKIAKSSRVKKLILTHISARFNNLDDGHLLDEAKEYFDNCSIAHDLMRVML
jgi:ribonuclease Z